MDNYIEQILDKRVSAKQVFYLVASCMVTFAGVVTLLFVHFGIGIAVAAVGGILIYYAHLSQSIEYEYLFVNGDCDIAQITSKASRKNIYAFKAGDVQRVLPYESYKFQNELEVNANLSIRNYTSGYSDASRMWYAFMVANVSGEVAVVLELNEKSLEHIRDFYKNKLEE